MQVTQWTHAYVHTPSGKKRSKATNIQTSNPARVATRVFCTPHFMTAEAVFGLVQSFGRIFLTDPLVQCSF